MAIEDNKDASATTSPDQAPETPQDGEEHAPTPFDHPLFLPVLLGGLALWFGYDGWLNAAEEMKEHRTFNRYGFGLLICLTIYFGIPGFKEWKQDRD